MLIPSKVLFVGWGDASGVSHYRTILPARTMGADFVIFDMDGRGVCRSGTALKYDIIVVQHCWTDWQNKILRKMRSTGAFTIINCDDWIRGIGKMDDNHVSSAYFRSKKPQNEHEKALREADGVLVATPWLQKRLLSLNPNVALARNGLDLDRYTRHHATEPPSEPVLGWAGGTGHRDALLSIAPDIEYVMGLRPELKLIIVGDDNAKLFSPGLADRVIQRPWSDMAFYPADLAKFTINLAPAMETDFYKAKSQLRFYEACAMGTPTVGHPMYDEIENMRTGYKASSRGWVKCIEALLDTDPVVLRDSCLDYAKEISIDKRISEWTSALTQLTSP